LRRPKITPTAVRRIFGLLRIGLLWSGAGRSTVRTSAKLSMASVSAQRLKPRWRRDDRWRRGDDAWTEEWSSLMTTVTQLSTTIGRPPRQTLYRTR